MQTSTLQSQRFHKNDSRLRTRTIRRAHRWLPSSNKYQQKKYKEPLTQLITVGNAFVENRSSGSLSNVNPLINDQNVQWIRVFMIAKPKYEEIPEMRKLLT
jgi:hypothetical protein